MERSPRHAILQLAAAAFALSVACVSAAAGHSLRFFGTGSGDVDRVKIRIDDPATSQPGPPVDVGATDFTIEFWLKATLADNAAASIGCGANEAWTAGNVVVDRDRFNQSRKFGIALAGGRVVFGVTAAVGDARTLCGTSNVADGAWHHVAVQRRRSDGWLMLYVDGALEAQADGPDGDVSYPDNAVPGSFCGGPCTSSDPFLVIGAGKHDSGAFPSYRGLVDELRVSNVLRYATNFAVPRVPFAPDVHTRALYHFDEGSGTLATDASFVPGAPTDGVLAVGGPSSGPQWSGESPFDLGTPSFALRPLAGSGLVHPVEITQAGDGSGRLFVVEQPGRVRIHRNGSLVATPFLDIASLVESAATERGLLGLAFHPDYRVNGQFFVFYTAKASATTALGDLVVARYRVSSNPNVADPLSGQRVIRIAHPGDNHNGGKIAFGPDGYLYIGVGDGGGGGDPDANGQSLDSLLGKLLRIDVDAASPYAIPLGNPFSAASAPPGLPEIWAYGLRNPWRFAFDALTGDLFIADVGQGAWEEVDFEPAGSTGGRNYGWRVFEGTHCFNPPTGCSLPNHAPPIIEYDHGLGVSITGGFRYRGTANPTLSGRYLFADFGSGRLWVAQSLPDGRWTHAHAANVTLPATFGQDEDGELYVASYSGTLHKLEPLDSDADGLPDWWEQAYFGSATAASPSADADAGGGDGASNLQEFRAGSDPRSSASRPASGDFTRDGLTDLLWRNRNDGSLMLWVTNLGVPETGSGGLPSLATGWRILATGDFDGDGRADLLWQDGAGSLRMWLMNGTRVVSTLAPSIGWVHPTTWKLVARGDFNADGRVDLVWQNQVDDSLALWLMNGASVTSASIAAPPRSYWTLAGSGDFDGDGRADLLWNSIAGDVDVWTMNGATVVARGAAGIGFASPAAWALAGIGDFDGDGKSDLLWRNKLDGNFGMWLLSGFAQKAGSAAFPGADASYWAVAGLGDFNADGRADIVWRSAANDIALWLMNGPSVIGTRPAGQGWVTSNWGLQPQ